MTATVRLGNGTQPPTPRKHALTLLTQAGFDVDTPITTQTGMLVPAGVALVATAEMESDLYVDAEGLPNPNGTVDRGWLQINSTHGDDPRLLLSDALYTARAAKAVYDKQGIRAWAAYSVLHADETTPLRPGYRYLRRIPPCYGGLDLIANAPTSTAAERQRANDQTELVRSVQAHLNAIGDSATGTVLVCDGGFGNLTRARLLEWKRKYHNDGHDRVDARVWLRMVGQGLR